MNEERVIFKIKLANHVFLIDSINEYTKKMCGDYLTEEPEEFSVRMEQADILRERELNRKQEEKGDHVYSDGYVESLAIYRKIAELLINENVVLFHGSVVAVDGKAYIFTAKSGTGKSTHTRNWRKVFGARAVMINDDKPLIHIDGDSGTATVFGTPWNGKHNLSVNTSARVEAVCVLKRGAANEISRIDFKEVYPMLMQQTYKMNDAVFLFKMMSLVDDMKKCIRFYELRCNMDEESAVVAFEGMQE